MMTMGSLFDGIGGFPLAAVHNGITPLWASEIEAFPIEVTKIRFPEMLHVGDITKLDGAVLPPVDVICGGSPCQDLSVAGQRAGLAGERSGLFMEQVRIAKEMRKADEQRNVPAHLIRPRYLVWENVPGAFSSAEGEDFRAVIEEIVRIKDCSCDVPRPEFGRWQSAGAAILGNEFSLAWRVLDAQFWGVAQRRRRIFLVADFGGLTAPEILFKQDGLLGDTAEGRSQRQGAAVSAQGCVNDTGGTCLTPWDVQSQPIFEETGTWPSLYSGEGGGHGYIQTEDKTAMAFAANQRDEVRDLHGVAGAIQAQPGMKQQTFVTDMEKINAFHVNQRDEVIDLDGVSGALLATRNMQMQTFITEPLICLNDHGGERMDITEEVTPTLRAGMGGHPPLVIQPSQVLISETVETMPAEAESNCETSQTGAMFAAGFCGSASGDARGIGFQEECSPTLKTRTAPSVLCLNDQGGSRMHCTEDITGTLRAQEHGHQPLVMATQQGGAEIGEGICPTITSAAGISGNNQPVLFKNHAKDCRYTGPLEVAPTVTSTYGTGGNNVPLVGDPVAFSLDSKESNSMKSANPHSGCRETDVARTIDTTTPDPSKNQGGIAILQETICIAGNTIDREPENGGNGLGCQSDISYTITTSDRHAVYEPYQDVVGALCRGDEKGIGSQYVSQDKCIVEKRNLIRRLTPLECERLQGFPDGWTLIPGASDSARYKALGNSVAIPCVDFVLRGIAYFLRKIHEGQEELPSCTSTPTT
ncbi:DNA cytosine methyltransferase [Erysipelothrix anatis]|uniref:DNA cytosine methyltransferase n=1 Tax=Erysipelothrix anatis TaxID=2683713 RepID=UPI001A9D1369|nr:DNA cytosine methyltransferase [Erysipelothrix anatis]